MGAVYKKELKSYFTNMTGWLFITFILLMAGIFIGIVNFKAGIPNIEYSLAYISYIFMLIVPILTMRSVAEERRLKTDQLLYSLPLSMTQIIVAKYLAMLTVFIIPCVIISIYPVFLSVYGTIDFRSIYGAMFGFVLLGASLIAICMFMSSLTENQIIAAVLSFAAVLVSNFIAGFAALVPSTAIASLIAFTVLVVLLALAVNMILKSRGVAFIIAGVIEAALVILYFVYPTALEGAFAYSMQWVSVFDRFSDFTAGIFDLTSVLYYLSVIGLFVFYTVQMVEKRRWS